MGHWINGAANDICIYRRYCVGCDMRPFIVHGNVGGVEANSFLCRVAWFWCTGIFFAFLGGIHWNIWKLVVYSLDKIVKRTYFVSEALLSSSDLGHYWWLLHWLLSTFKKQRRKITILYVLKTLKHGER